MPPAIGILGAFLFASQVAMVAVGIAVTIGLGFIQRALAPKSPKADAGVRGRDLSVRQPDPLRQFVFGTRVVGGAFLPVTMAGTDNEFFYFIMLWCEGFGTGVEEIVDIRFGDEVAVTGTTPLSKYSGFITVEHHLGADDQTASSLLTTDVPGAWTSTDRLRGIAYTVFKLKYDADKFSSFSVENIRAKIKGARLLDPRTGTVSATASANPAVQARAFLASTRFGPGVPVTEIDDAEFIASANICDELVNVKAGGTRARYATHATFLADRAPGVVLEEFRRSMAGTFTYSEWKYALRAGAWRPPHLSLGDSDIIGPVEVTANLGRAALANGIRGEFTETTHWQPTNYPPIQPAGYLTADGNIALWKNTDFPFVTDAEQAQQLALVELRKLRQQKRMLLDVKLKGYELVPGDTFLFTHTRFAGRETWVDKTFFVERVVLAGRSEKNSKTYFVRLEVREETPEVYAFNTADVQTFTALPSPGMPSASPSPFVAPSNDPTLRPNLNPGSFADSNPGLVTGAQQLAQGDITDTSGAWTVATTVDFDVPEGIASLVIDLYSSAIGGAGVMNWPASGDRMGASIHTGSPPATPQLTSATSTSWVPFTFTNPVGNKLTLYMRGAGTSIADSLRVKAAQDITTPLRGGFVS